MIAPPYTIGVTWDPQNGSFIEGSTTYTSSNPKAVDSNIDEDGTKTYSGFSHPTNVKSNDPKKVFYGWNTDKNATKDTPTGWWYKADGKVDVTSTKTSTTLYAIYQDGFPMNWNVSKFGGSTASLGERITGTSNVFTVAANGQDGQEVVAISNSANSTGTVRFPKQADLANGARFLGWTNNADGSAPSGGYFKYEDGVYTVSATGLSGPRTSSVSTANSTWYAVWETDVQFQAASYGGTIYGKTGDEANITAKMTVKNNQPIASGMPAVKTSDAADGNIVPNQYNNTGYDASMWKFKGWTKTENPNNKNGMLGGSTQQASNVSPAPSETWTSADLIPNGATTYYAVWECALSWKAMDPDKGVTFRIGNASAVTGDRLYGFNVTTPIVVKTDPFSHSFKHWEDTVGNLSTGMNTDTSSADYGKSTYAVRTGGPVTAIWVANEGKVKLDSQGGTIDGVAKNQQTYAVWGQTLRAKDCANRADFDADNGDALKVPTRTGYEFAGYWNHPYSENTANDGEFSGKIKCYYMADGGTLKPTVDAWNLVGTGITLYAHWRYKVVLDLNAYDSDGDIVASGSGYTASIESGFAPATEQQEANDTTLTVPRSTASDKGTTNVSAYTFTAIDGAPIQLPKAVGRTGYADTSRWTYGSTTLRANGSSMNDPFMGDPAALDGSGTDHGYVLKADWSDDPDGIDGGGAGTTTYNVTYAAGEGATTPSGGPAATTIRYDGKIATHPGPGGFAKTGYHFTGWKASTTGDKLYKEGATDVYAHRYDSDVTFTAQWEPNVYPVKLHGAADDAADEQTVYMKYGVGWYDDAACTTAANVSAPAREGYECVGFADSVTETTPAFFTETDASDSSKRLFDTDGFPSNTKYSDDDVATVRELYPVWRADVTWSDPSATTGAFTDTEYAYAHNGADTQVSHRDQGSRAGYAPSGWQVRYGEGDSATYLKADGSIGALSDGEAPKLFTTGTIPVAGACTIEATWTPVTYTITFDLGEAKYPEESASDFQVTAGSGFAGTTQNTPSVAKAADGRFKATSQFNATASSASLARPYEGASGTITLPQFACTGYAFEGWTVPDGVTLTDNGDGSYSFAISSDTASVLGNLTFTAKWGSAPEAYDLTTSVLMRDGESGAYGTPDASADMFDDSLPETYAVSGLPLSDLSAKPGYVFEGWKAYKTNDASTTMLRQGGSPVDNLAASDLPVKQGESADKVSIAPGMTDDGKVTLVAYFTKVRYGVTLQMAGIDDAAFKNSADAAKWDKATADDGAVTYTLKGGFTVDAATAGGIALPVFDRAGYAFGGFSGGTFSDDGQKLLLQKSYESGRGLQDYALTAKWTPGSYGITYEFAHMDAVDHPHDADSQGKYAFDGSATLGASIQIKPPTPDADYYDSFDGWVIEDADKSLNLGGHGLTYSDAEKGWMLSSDPAIGTIEIDRDSLRDFFPDDATSLTLRATYTPRTYTATLELNGGAMPDGYDADRWKAQDDGTYKAEYTCDDENIPIPVPWKFGCTFGGWKLDVTTDAGTETDASVDKATFGDDTEAKPAILHDSIGARVYSVPLSDDPTAPGWAGVEGTIVFDANGGDAGSVPGGAHEVTFGKMMPEKGAGGAAFAVPTREGYDFAGFFDTPNATGGKQYYNASFGSARAWDKNVQFYQEGEAGFVEGATNVKPHTLYARWTKKAPAGTPEGNLPKPAEIVYGDPVEYDPETGEPIVDEDASSALVIRSQVSDTNSDECATPALDAFFNGQYTLAANGTATVDVSSYVWCDLSAREVYDGFNAANDPAFESKAEDEREYLAGFLVESTGDVIAFSDLAQGNALSFTIAGADATAVLADGKVRSLGIASTGVVALYGDTPYDFGSGAGGEPPVVDWEDLPTGTKGTVQVVFKAEGGTIEHEGKTAETLYLPTEFTKAEGSTSLTLSKPADPTRAGYEFAGWSLMPQAEHAASECTCTKGDLKATDILKKTYYAHWREATYRVAFDANHDGIAATGAKDIVFGSTEPLSSYGLDDAFTTRAGYLFLGYFDARAGGVQYFTSTGAATRVWDKVDENPATTLYAHWMIDPSSPDAPAIDPSPDVPAPAVPPSTEPTPVDPSDLFPPQRPSVMIPTDGESTLSVPTTAGLTALDGRYEGVYAETAAGDAAIVMNAYAAANVPGDYATAELSLRAMIGRFEASSAAAGQYLQGFRVISTGSFVSVADLYEGNSVTITAKTDDLVRAEGSASVAFVNNRVEPVFGPTPAIPPAGAEPGEWPVEGDLNADPPVQATQIYNVFDARGGLFGTDDDAKRFMVCPTGYRDVLEVPTDESDAAIIPIYAKDVTYHFDGWFTADGTRVTDKDGKLVDANLRQEATVPTTYYARYVRTYYLFELYDSNDGVDAAHAGSTDKISDFRPYAGETLTQMATAQGEFAGSLPPARDGYDFVGYFFRGDDGVEYPLYLSATNGAKAHADYAAFEDARTAQEAHGGDDGWGAIPGVAGNDADKDHEPDTAIKLYAKWNPMTYTVQWVYNWAGRDYTHMEDGKAAPNLEKPVTATVPFGMKVLDATAGGAGDAANEMAVPVIHDPGYAFKGWYAGATADAKDFAVRLPVEYTQADKEDTASASYADNYFTQRGDSWYFEPKGIANLADRWPRTVTFYATFDLKTQEPYSYRVYLGRTADEAAHGEFKSVSSDKLHTDARGIQYYEDTYYAVKKDFEVSTNFRSAEAKTGYTGPQWYATVEAADSEALPKPVKIAKGSTGLKEFYLGWAAGSYELQFSTNTLHREGEDGLVPPDGDIALTGGTGPVFSSDDFDKKDVVLPEPEGAVGYEFAGWKKLNPDGTFMTGSNVYRGNDLGAFNETLVETHFGGNPSGTLSFGAVWEPLRYRVNFHEHSGSAGASADPFESYLLVSEGGELADLGDGAVTRDHKLVLPYPHTSDVGKPFAHWSLFENDGAGECEGWTSGSELSLCEILDKMEGFPTLNATYDEDEDLYRIDIFANWKDVDWINASTPLQVNILVDPYSPSEPTMGKIVTSSAGDHEVEGAAANAWVMSLSEQPVRIESLTFERGEDDLFELADGTDGGDKLTLKIYGGGKKDGDEANVLRLPMGKDTAKTVVLRDDATSGAEPGSAAQGGHVSGERMYLSDYGMGDELSKGERIWLYYDLELDPALTDLTGYKYLMEELLDKHETGENGQPTSERLSAPLARLYYTIGLVPSA